MKSVKFVKENLNENLYAEKYLYAIYKFGDDEDEVYTDFFFATPQQAIRKFEKRKKGEGGTFGYYDSVFLIQINLDAISRTPGSIIIGPETEKSRGGVKIIKSTVGEDRDYEDDDY